MRAGLHAPTYGCEWRSVGFFCRHCPYPREAGVLEMYPVLPTRAGLINAVRFRNFSLCSPTPFGWPDGQLATTPLCRLGLETGIQAAIRGLKLRKDRS